MFGVTFIPGLHRPPVFIDHTPSIVSLFEAGRISAPVASALIGHGCCRTIGYAARKGRRWIKLLPGIGPKAMAEIETLAVELEVEIAP